MKTYSLPALMLGLSALLTACPGPTPPAPTNDSVRLSGTIPNWKAGAAKVGFYFTVSDQVVAGSSEDISASGALNTVLPVPSTTASFLGGCVLSAGATGSDFQVEYANAVAFTPAGDLLGVITETTSSGLPVLRLYSSSAATLKGTSTCTKSREDYDLKVNAGWNTITLTSTVINGITTYSYRNIATDSTFELGFVAVKPTVTVTPLDSTSLTLKAGESVTRNYRFSTTGALSGTLNLSTSLPGVKVTPDSISASGISGQSLRPTQAQEVRAVVAAQPSPSRLRPHTTVQGQSITAPLTLSLTEDAVTYNGSMDLLVSQDGQTLGKTAMHADIQAPSVRLSFNNLPLSVYRNSQNELKLTLTSQNNFNGNVTLTLAGLPTGVTASPLNVNVPTGASTTISWPLQIANDATLGEVEVRVSGAKLQQDYPGTTSFPLLVKPARTPLGALPSSVLTPAAEGVWLMTTYNTTTQEATLSRYVRGQKAIEVKVNTQENNPLLALPTGEVYVIGAGSSLYRLKDDGTLSIVGSNTSSGSMSRGAVDNQGRIWYIGTTLST